MKMIIKLVLIFLINWYFSSFMKIEKEKGTVSFSIFCENEKQMTVLKIQSKNLF